MTTQRRPAATATWPHLLFMAVILVALVVLVVLVVRRFAAASRTTETPAAAQSHPMHALPPLVLPPALAEIPLLPLPPGAGARGSASSLRGGGYRMEEYLTPPAGALDLRTRVAPIPVYRQLYGDCPEQALAYLVEYMSAREHGRAFRPSRLLMSFDNTRFESAGHPELLKVLQRTVGGPYTGGVNLAGTGTPTHCAATLMLRGMVDERAYPYPTVAQVKAQSAAIARVRAAFEAVRPLGAHPSATALSQWRAQVERAITADGAYLRALARPPPAVERLALRNRVGRTLVLDPNDLDTLRKCLTHVGPVAFGMHQPWWLVMLGNQMMSRRATDAAVQELLAGERPSAFTAEQRRFLRLLPACSDVVLANVRNGITPKQQGVVITRWFHTHRFPLSWTTFPHRSPPPFTAEQGQRFTAALVRHYNALDAASRRELNRLPYPHDEEARHIRALEAADGFYAKAQRIMRLNQEYALNIDRDRPGSEGDDPFAREAKGRPAVGEALDYFQHQVKGGHAMVIVGYDDAQREFTVRNSWGEQWGDHGHFYMSYDFFSTATDNALRSGIRWVNEAVCVARVELAPPSHPTHAVRHASAGERRANPPTSRPIVRARRRSQAI